MKKAVRSKKSSSCPVTRLGMHAIAKVIAASKDTAGNAYREVFVDVRCAKQSPGSSVVDVPLE